MSRITKRSQEALDIELAKYKDYIINRAQSYAEQERSIDIKEAHISKAALDFRNDFYLELRKKQLRERRRWLFYLSLLGTIISLILFLAITLYNNWGSGVDTATLLSRLGVFLSALLVGLYFLYLIKVIHAKKKQSDSQIKIVAFLNKWNQLEALLRNLYKKNNHKEAKTLSDLLQFYVKLPLVCEQGKQESIVSLLNARNNLLHRGIREVNSDTIIRLNGEIDEIIDILKTT